MQQVKEKCLNALLRNALKMYFQAKLRRVLTLKTQTPCNTTMWDFDKTPGNPLTLKSFSGHVTIH